MLVRCVCPLILRHTAEVYEMIADHIYIDTKFKSWPSVAIQMSQCLQIESRQSKYKQLDQLVSQIQCCQCDKPCCPKKESVNSVSLFCIYFRYFYQHISQGHTVKFIYKTDPTVIIQLIPFSVYSLYGIICFTRESKQI